MPALFSWTGLVVCIVGIHLFGQSITMGYHRLLTHRSFVAKPWFEHLLVVLALCSMEDTPARWVATHRMHHAHSDESQDPHSPLVNAIWGHVGWLFVQNRALHNAANYETYAHDVLRNRFYLWLELNPWRSAIIYMLHVMTFFGVAFLIAWPIWGASEALLFGASIVTWGVILRTIIVWHITWSVNSLTHLFGYRNHDTGENSRNNWFVALVSAGEGWHNNHHHDQKSCSVRHRWWELDVTHLEIRLLKRLGIVSSIVPRREVRQAEALRQAERRAEDTSFSDE
ncbi:MAG: fatty acid desaturase [Phycisphaerales bacterium]|nr:fatty acid desaturase [Phycisphaerales bacterium]